MLIFIGLETKGVLDFEGRHGIASVVRWNLRPVIFGVGPEPKPEPFGLRLGLGLGGVQNAFRNGLLIRSRVGLSFHRS